MSKIVRKLGFWMTLLLILAFLLSSVCAAPSPDVEMTASLTLPLNALKHYLGSVVNTGLDNGYSGKNVIEAKDSHFGWTLGRFFVSGYTRVSEDAKGDPVFIKTLGDRVTLWFALEQDIESLNGDDKLVISEDINGYDEYFGIGKTNFGRGTLIIRHTDYQNSAQEPTMYTDYLAAKVVVGADTEVELFEEGDYEVALNYEIKNTWQRVLEQNIIDSYTNYRIFFRFSVRNGNCMVYPFDVATKAEMTNSAMTENGFYLDLAKSRYLDINIKKEVLTDGIMGLTEDTRFNRPAKDGDEYTEEGIYTIDVSNRYTGQQTTKQIYVGTNDVLKAHVTTGLSIEEIDEQIVLGALIRDDGVLVPTSSRQTAAPNADEELRIHSPEPVPVAVRLEKEPESPSSSPTLWTIVVSLIVLCGILAVLCIVLAVVLHKRGSSKNRDGGAHNVNAEREEKDR